MYRYISNAFSLLLIVAITSVTTSCGQPNKKKHSKSDGVINFSAYDEIKCNSLKYYRPNDKIPLERCKNDGVNRNRILVGVRLKVYATSELTVVKGIVYLSGPEGIDEPTSNIQKMDINGNDETMFGTYYLKNRDSERIRLADSAIGENFDGLAIDELMLYFEKE